jgi:hypothetical protein
MKLAFFCYLCATMINEVRETVMAILSKDSNGYITPHEFNLFAKQAQLDIFEDYMTRHQRDTVMSIQRANNSGASDKKRISAELLDKFSADEALTQDSLNMFLLPSNYFTLNEIYYNSEQVEYVPKQKLMPLLGSKLTAPTEKYPAYTFYGQSAGGDDRIIVYPDTIQADVSAIYTRYPVDPKWTYTVAGGNPLFNLSASDYQDFELPLQDFNDLVIKICMYAGVNIRETEIVQVMQALDAGNKSQGE